MKQFRDAKKWLGGLDGAAVGRLVTGGSDISLVISDPERGLIADVSQGSDALSGAAPDRWVGKRWADALTVESRPKAQEMLREARSDGTTRWRTLNHAVEGGPDVPVAYMAMKLGPDGPVVVFGRSLQSMANLQQQLLSAQQAMENELVKLRQAEARHRLLFQVASEAVLIVDARSLKVLEANPAACRLLGEGARRVIGRAFPDGFDGPGTQAVRSLLGAVAATGRNNDVMVRSADGARQFQLSASLFREERSSFLLVRLVAQTADQAALMPSRESKVLEIVASAPEGFVVTDPQGRILFANQAFLDLIQLATEEQVRNQSLDRWLGRTGVDFNLLMSQVRDRGGLRLFATQMRGEYGSSSDVEICAVTVVDGDESFLGFTIRDVGQRTATGLQLTRDKPRSVQQLTELVGKVPLKELVRESTDMIEKLCIEAALEITGDNRASAADMLGLSRQSLYSKLRRYGLGDLAVAEGEQTE